MQDLLDSIDTSTLTDTGLELGINVLLAIAILIIGMWIAKRVDKIICALSKGSQHLDETLFKFLGSLARYVILAFVIVAVLNRFGFKPGIGGGIVLGDLFGINRGHIMRHEGHLPLTTVEHIWREIISAFTAMQAPYAIVAGPAEDSMAMRDAVVRCSAGRVVKKLVGCMADNAVGRSQVVGGVVAVEPRVEVGN